MYALVKGVKVDALICVRCVNILDKEVTYVGELAIRYLLSVVKKMSLFWKLFCLSNLLICF